MEQFEAEGAVLGEHVAVPARQHHRDVGMPPADLLAELDEAAVVKGTTDPILGEELVLHDQLHRHRSREIEEGLLSHRRRPKPDLVLLAAMG